MRRNIKKRAYAFTEGLMGEQERIQEDLKRIGYRQVGKIKAFKPGWAYVRCYYVGKRKAHTCEPLPDIDARYIA